MTTYSEGVKEFGLFKWTCMEIARRKRDGGYKPVSGQWFAAPVGANRVKRGKGTLQFVPPVFELPVKPLKNLATINAVEEPEPEVSDDDMQELSLAPIPISAGDESEADEEGTVSEDATVNVDAE